MRFTSTFSGSFSSLLPSGLCLLLSTLSWGQPQMSGGVNDVTMAAPNAAALGKYGDIPVSYFPSLPVVCLSTSRLPLVGVCNADTISENAHQRPLETHGFKWAAVYQ